MTREKLRQHAIENILSYKRVALQWATSMGKSRAAIDIIKGIINNELKKDYNKSTFKTLLVVAESSHKENWQSELEKWGRPNFTTITIECYASLKNYRNTKWDLVILDEAHHIGSELRLDIISDIKTNYLLLLSATLPARTIWSLESIFGKIYISKVSLENAIKWNVLTEPKIFVIPLELDRANVKTYTFTEKGKKVTKQLSDKQYYMYLSNLFDYYKQKYLRSRIERFKNLWLQQGSKRKRFLGEIKTDISKKLLEKVKNNRYICFCTSISQAEKLGGKNTIHSKKSNSLEIINKFNNKEISNLYAVNMAQEGCNLTDIEIGVIIQLDGNERAFIQKTGRAMRAEEPIVFIFYYKNTRDEEYLKSALDGIDNNYITVIEDLDNFEL